MNDQSRPTIVAFACCERYFGAAILGPEVILRVTRIRGREALEDVRLRAWIECLVAIHAPRLIAVVAGSPRGDVIEEAARRIGLSIVELKHGEIAETLDTSDDTVRAIGAAALTRESDTIACKCVVTRDRPGPRSEAERYWQMALLALGAALAAEAIAKRALPGVHGNARSPSP